MKNIGAIILSVFFVIISLDIKASGVNCTLEITSDIIFIDGLTINPGDVICLLPGNKDYLLLKDIQGTEDQPITIINKGGAVIINTDHFYGIKFDNCKHVILSGSGEEGLQYGIQIQRVGNGAGMSVDNRSTNVEISSVEIAYTLIGGIYAKTEPYQGDCNNLVTRENFTMYNLSIHDCYLHHIADEGMYIGSSKYTGQTIAQCDNIEVLPHIIEGVSIYNNIVENTGWDGIQVSSAPSECNVFDNLIRYDSYEEEPYQMSGMLIGGGAKCDCYNNKIFDGKGDGIDVFGLGYMKIYNNLIVRAGRTFKPDEPSEYKHGIYIGEVVNIPNATFELYNNTIVSPKSSGIKYSNQEAYMGYIKNNIISNPGLNEYIIIDNGISHDKVETSHNFNVPANSNVKFVDEGDNNFDLKPNSDAVNYGTSLTNQGITFDIDNRFRPFHTYFDAGAYECHDPYAGIEESEQNLIGNPYPIPATNFLNIPIYGDINKTIKISIISITGKTLYSSTLNNSQILGGKITVDISNLKAGKYITWITIGNQSISRPLIIIK